MPRPSGHAQLLRMRTPLTRPARPPCLRPDLPPIYLIAATMEPRKAVEYAKAFREMDVCGLVHELREILPCCNVETDQGL